MAKKASFYHHLHPKMIPARSARFRYTFGLGGLSILMGLILGITGILELFYYIPSQGEANRSLQMINLLVPYGQFVRSLHYWSAQALVVISILHLVRVLLTGAYKQPRRFNWLLGMMAFVLILFLNFTGYALRWDVDIAWALVVGTNLLKTIPVIGFEIYELVVGSPEISPLTVVRLYGWHIYGLTLILAFGVGWHVFRVRRDGGISRIASHERSREKISREVLVRREAQVALVATILLVIVAKLFPPDLGPAADFNNLPAEATAPWFFLWIQELLRHGSPFVMGILIPLVILILLLLVPYLFDRTTTGVGQWFNPEGRLAQIILLLIIIFGLGLTLMRIL